MKKKNKQAVILSYVLSDVVKVGTAFIAGFFAYSAIPYVILKLLDKWEYMRLRGIGEGTDIQSDFVAEYLLIPFTFWVWIITAAVIGGISFYCIAILGRRVYNHYQSKYYTRFDKEDIYDS